MARLTVINKLEQKQGALLADVKVQRDSATAARELAKAADIKAELNEKQAAAVTEALGILEAAGVVI
jgi:hypothetical protein